MAIFNKVNGFVEHVCEGMHNLASDKLRLTLSNTAPSAETPNPTINTADAFVTNVTQINMANLGANDRDVPVASSSQTGGLYTLKTTAGLMTLTASGGSVGPFRYVYLYNDTNGALIGWWDYGTALTMGDGESLEVDIDAATNNILSLRFL